MNQNNNEMPISLWDNWKHQCYNMLHDEQGAHCAMGYLMATHYADYAQVYLFKLEPIAKLIRELYQIPATYYHPGGGALRPGTHSVDCIVYANNVLRLTPEEFREIDIAAQVDAAVRPLVELVEVEMEVQS